MAGCTRLCDDCVANGYTFCPNTNTKRREQNREAQRRWREKQKATKGEKARLIRRIIELENEIRTLKRNEGGSLKKVLDAAGGYKRLLTLTHPDRHNGSELANKVTRAILEVCK